MSFLKYFDDEEIEQIKETFEENLFSKINEENILKIITYLLENKVDYWKDIFIYYFDLCILDSQEFIEKFEKLKEKYGILEIGEDLSLLEGMI